MNVKNALPNEEVNEEISVEAPVGIWSNKESSNFKKAP